MTSFNDLQQIIDRGEDTQTEFKEVLSEEVLRGLPTDLAAIANSQGGRIIFGVKDNKDLIGITLAGNEFDRISQCASNCHPAILAEPEEIRSGSQSFIIVKVPKSNLVHNDNKNRFPIRLGTTTQYLDGSGLVALLLERGVFRSEALQTSAFSSQQLRQERLALPESDAARILRHLTSKDPTIRLEALRDTMSVQYRIIFLENKKIADALGTLLSSEIEAEVKMLLNLLGGVAQWGSSEEKKIVAGWANTILRIGKAAASLELSKAALNVLMYSKHRGAVDLLDHWVTSLDDSSWTTLQLNTFWALRIELRGLAQDEMYKILEDPKANDAIKKRALAVLDVLRQIG
jgi:hypothetical protein